MTRLLAAALAALTLAAPAQASSVSVFNQDAEGLTFERQRGESGGTYGVEFANRQGDRWARIGTATQLSSGTFHTEADHTWSETGSFFRFIYAQGGSEISLSQNEDFSNATTARFDNLFFDGSDALIFEAKNRPDLTLTKFNGQDLFTGTDAGIDIGKVGGSTWSDWEKVVFVSKGITDGFTLEGKINMVSGNTSTINIDLGTASKKNMGGVAPIPVPAALPLLLAGLGGLMLLRRYRRG